MKNLSAADSAELKGTAILRLDFNTEDTWRMEAALPTINFLSEKSYKIIILSHKGRPEGIQPEFSLRNDTEILKGLLGKEVDFFSEFDFPEIKREVDEAPKGNIFVLENLRFLPGESANDESLAKEIASLGNFYVNDAFAVSHRKAASIVSVPKFLPSYAGLGLESEIINLNKVMKNPEHPFTLILGGGKADEKLEIVKFLYDKIDSALLGGVPANTLLKLKGVSVDGSVIAEEPEKFEEFMGMDKIILPEDWVLDGEKILDIGEKTIDEFKDMIKNSKTIVWNGPLGLIERNEFTNGSKKIAEAICDSNAFSLVGGGETVMFLKKLGLDGKMSFVSTGGGAMLDFLAGKELPGIEALEKYD